MGYRLEIASDRMTPYGEGDPITLAGMDRLLYVARIAGVDLDTPKRRSWEGKGGKRAPVTASLERAFTSNDGWFITPGEAKELSEALPAVAEDSTDPQFIREMAKYFLRASRNGGLFVY